MKTLSTPGSSTVVPLEDSIPVSRPHMPQTNLNTMSPEFRINKRSVLPSQPLKEISLSILYTILYNLICVFFMLHRAILNFPVAFLFSLFSFILLAHSLFSAFHNLFKANMICARCGGSHTWEIKTVEATVQGCPQLHDRFKASQGYMKHCLKKNKNHGQVTSSVATGSLPSLNTCIGHREGGN